MIKKKYTDEEIRIIAEFNKLTEISQGYSGRIKLFEENEIEI